jgi:Mg-chelatase subunit ChlD
LFPHLFLDGAVAQALPYQGMTNITAGVSLTVDCVVESERRAKTPGSIHHVLVLLTDGNHNKGLPPDAGIPAIARKLQSSAPSAVVSVVVVGVSRNSQTELGMIVRVLDCQTYANPTTQQCKRAAFPGSAC